jgi:hypothetical protein
MSHNELLSLLGVPISFHPGVRDGVELSNDLFFYIPLNIIVRSYRLIKKLYVKLTQKTQK